MHPFNPYRRALSLPLKSLCNRAVEAVESHERQTGIRQRKRRKAAQDSLNATVEAVVCDLVHAHLTTHAQLSVYLTKNAAVYPRRYRSPIENAAFVATLGVLEATHWLALVKGSSAAFTPWNAPPYVNTCSKMRPGPRLTEWLAGNPVRLDDMQRLPAGELIVLKRPKVNLWDHGGVIDYADTSATNQHREEMAALNEWLRTFDLSAEGIAADVGERQLTRIFNNGRFDHGGRLYGGFWQTMPREDRSAVRINGEKVAVLDYGQTFPRLLYGLENAQPPSGDLYALPGLPAEARAGVKLLFSALLFMDKPPTQAPKKARSFFASGLTVENLLTALRTRHAPIAHHLPSQVGFKLFLKESEILLAVLRACRTRDLPALPIHDALLVPASKADAARFVMETVFKEKTGGVGNISVSLAQPPQTTLRAV